MEVSECLSSGFVDYPSHLISKKRSRGDHAVMITDCPSGEQHYWRQEASLLLPW